jgi:hypothetical protein
LLAKTLRERRKRLNSQAILNALRVQCQQDAGVPYSKYFCSPAYKKSATENSYQLFY